MAKTSYEKLKGDIGCGCLVLVLLLVAACGGLFYWLVILQPPA